MATAAQSNNLDTPEKRDSYSFKLMLAGNHELTDALADKLFEAQCDDAVLGNYEGTTYLAFDREADSLEDAIRSAIADVERAGFEVDSVVPPGVETIKMVNAFLSLRKQLQKTMESQQRHGVYTAEQAEALYNIIKSASGGSHQLLQIFAEYVGKRQ